MGELRVKTTVKLEGMEHIKELIEIQQRLIEELAENASEIEKAERQLNLEIAMERGSHE